MGSPCFVLLLVPFFLSECLGNTEFIYTAREEVHLVCTTNKWQISTESESRFDEACTLECDQRESQYRNNILKSCTYKDSDNVVGNCTLIARRGFFRCVSALDSGFLFPFKPSPNTVTSYILAPANEEMTSESEERSAVVLTVGADLLLNCSFRFTGGYNNTGFTVYWIKTMEKDSICVYSYDYGMYSVEYNHHCNVPEDHRLSNQTYGQNIHNIWIRNVTEPDVGRYLCVLHVHTDYKANWKIINNITVGLYKDGGSEISDPSITLIPLYATLSILLLLVVLGIIWKKTKTSPRAQMRGLPRKQDGENTSDASDTECSPYAVGIGEDEIRFQSKKDAENPEGQNKTLYSVMKRNDLYEFGS